MLYYVYCIFIQISQENYSYLLRSSDVTLVPQFGTLKVLKEPLRDLVSPDSRMI